MPKSASWPRLLAASLTFVTLLGSAAWGQQSQTVRIRGTIEAVDGPMLSIKSREGTDMEVRLTDNVAVFGVARTELSEIKEGSYIGVTALPEPDGTQKAVAVHIFPENQRGAAEGFRPWDQRPNSTMTNATVAQTVKGTDGQNILVKYKDGEKKVVVPEGTPIVTFVAGDKSELKPGAKIIIFGAVKKTTARWKPIASMSAVTGSHRRCEALVPSPLGEWLPAYGRFARPDPTMRLRSASSRRRRHPDAFCIVRTCFPAIARNGGLRDGSGGRSFLPRIRH